MELIGGKTAHTYILSICCRVKQWIQRNKSYNQIKMCMCIVARYVYSESGMNMDNKGMRGLYEGERLILLLLLRTISLLEFEIFERTWAVSVSFLVLLFF